jgi:hypothetical protein
MEPVLEILFRDVHERVDCFAPSLQSVNRPLFLAVAVVRPMPQGRPST